MLPIGAVWQAAIETPLINFMVFLSVISFGSYGVAILVFTIIGLYLRGPYWNFYWPWEAWPDIPSRI